MLFAADVARVVDKLRSRDGTACLADFTIMGTEVILAPLAKLNLLLGAQMRRWDAILVSYGLPTLIQTVNN